MRETKSKVPIQKLQNQFTIAHNVQLAIKREDLIDDDIPGNKYRKLIYNLEEAGKLSCRTILTFGGAYSNHIAAVAAAGKRFGFKTIGVIRGEAHFPMNNTLKLAELNGMELYYMDRETFRRKHKEEVLESLRSRFGEFYNLPEGGSNLYAVKGCMEILDQRTAEYDVICCPVGTGGTLAGIVAAMATGQEAMGFSALKGGSFLHNDVQHLLDEYHRYYGPTQLECPVYSINNDYHFDGYAKVSPALMDFVDVFQQRTAIQLDYIYTAKMAYGVYELIKAGHFDDKQVLMIHTGGIQGNAGILSNYNK